MDIRKGTILVRGFRRCAQTGHFEDAARLVRPQHSYTELCPPRQETVLVNQTDSTEYSALAGNRDAAENALVQC